MPKNIADFCAETGQPVPADTGAYMRCIYESLALFYRVTLRKTERLTGKKIERLHIVGGGSQDETLNQFSANALKIPVLRRPRRNAPRWATSWCRPSPWATCPRLPPAARWCAIRLS